MNIKEIEAFATTQTCPCHCKMRVGGLLITLLSLSLMGELMSANWTAVLKTSFVEQLLYLFDLFWV